MHIMKNSAGLWSINGRSDHDMAGTIRDTLRHVLSWARSTCSWVTVLAQSGNCCARVILVATGTQSVPR